MDLTIVLTKPQLLLIQGGRGLHGINHHDDAAVLDELLTLLRDGAPNFVIAAP